jgi:glycosyltransferase involved in cell wall biosynthesis
MKISVEALEGDRAQFSPHKGDLRPATNLEKVRFMEETLSVSVVIPTFKRLTLLKRAIDSVYRQTWQNWELIVTDDENPPGKTWDYLSALAATDARVRVSRNPGPHGQSGNINNGLKLVQGRWVKILFDDDVLKPECIEKLLLAICDDPTIAIVTLLLQKIDIALKNQ